MKQRDFTARALNALSHPRRVMIFDKLEAAGQPGMGFGALMAATGLQVSTLRHHLRPMIASGLVMRRRKGLNVTFHLHGADMRDVTETIAARLAELPRNRARPRIEVPLN